MSAKPGELLSLEATEFIVALFAMCQKIEQFHWDCNKKPVRKQEAHDWNADQDCVGIWRCVCGRRAKTIARL